MPLPADQICVEAKGQSLIPRQRLLTLTQAALHRHHINPAAEFHADRAHGAHMPEAE